MRQSLGAESSPWLTSSEGTGMLVTHHMDVNLAKELGSSMSLEADSFLEFPDNYPGQLTA